MDAFLCSETLVTRMKQSATRTKMRNIFKENRLVFGKNITISNIISLVNS